MAKKDQIPQKIIDMTAKKARSFLLRNDTYCNIDLPPYFNFEPLLKALSKQQGIRLSEAKKYENVNYTIVSNKDGQYAWRPLSLINPIAYVQLVKLITTESNWKSITDKFRTFQSNPKIVCTSIPVTKDNKNDKATQILTWWEHNEQESINLSLDYSYISNSDISDCYASIYTHSIAWAIDGKEESQTAHFNGNNTGLGNQIDDILTYINHAQTNSIPQGSGLMDFIAEILLGYADHLLTNILNDPELNYHIVRYRDDYRIFTNSRLDSETIIKSLSGVLLSLGLKLNSSKTKTSRNIIESSIKEDKLALISNTAYINIAIQRHLQRNNQTIPYNTLLLQKYLLLIHRFAHAHPNSGSLIRQLDEFQNIFKQTEKKSINNQKQIVAILIDIAVNNPKTYPLIAASLSIAINSTKPNKAKLDLLRRIIVKISKIPYNSILELWIQRICITIKNEDACFSQFKDKLCLVVSGHSTTIWNTDWIANKTIKDIIDNPRKHIIDEEQLKKLSPEISRNEFAIFDY